MNPTNKQKKSTYLMISVGATIALIVAFLLVKIFVFSNYVVYQSSMEPTFYEGDVVWANKLKNPTYGDVVLVTFEMEDKKDILIKRVVGLGGDLLWVEESGETEGEYFLCRQKSGSTTEERLVKEVYDGITIERMGLSNLPKIFYEGVGFVAIGKDNAVEVPQDSIYCLGDNRGSSLDSRDLGAFSNESLVGVVVARGMGVFWAIVIPVAVFLVVLTIIVYFPKTKNQESINE
ncbi:MAG: signal peptidase I [Clostridia bacterium]|nr:signal peptidase I [Clostridia bacterium]